MPNSRAALSVGKRSSVCRMKARYGSTRLGRSGDAGAGSPAWASTRRTVSRCTCSWRAMVPTRQRSALYRRKILALRSAGMTNEMLPSRTGFDHARWPPPHAMAQEALADPWRQRRGTAPAPHGARRREGAGHRGGEFGAGGQWSIQRRRRTTLMRHEVDDAAVEDGGVIRGGVMTGALLPCTILAPLAPTA